MFTRLEPDWESWLKARAILQATHTSASYTTWIEPLIPLAIEEDGAGGEAVLYMKVPDTYIRNSLEARYLDKFANAFLESCGRLFTFRFLLPAEADAFLTKMSQETKKETPAKFPPPQLNPKYTFDTFVIGNSNRFVHAASLAVAEAPAQAYNPLFIYGGVGLGKTHLMHAIGHFIREADPSMNIVYVSSEKFTNDLINAIQTNSTQAFRDSYRNVDVLMIDDIQFIAGKTSTQEELFHTFNALHESQKQIILSSDKPPREMKTLEARLQSRFEWGLIADIQPPDLETRIAILRKKAEAEGLVNIDDNVMEFIATNSENNIRELEGALTRVIAYSKLTGLPIDLDLVHQALRDVLNANAGRRATPENIMRLVCDRFGITESEFLSRRRNQEIAHPRKIAMYLTRELTDFSLSAIGEAFGGRDHTTVLHAWRTISEEMATNSELRILLADLRRHMQEK